MTPHPPPFVIWCTKCGAIRWAEKEETAEAHRLNHANWHVMHPQMGHGVKVLVAKVVPFSVQAVGGEP